MGALRKIFGVELSSATGVPHQGLRFQAIQITTAVGNDARSGILAYSITQPRNCRAHRSHSRQQIDAENDISVG